MDSSSNTSTSSGDTLVQKTAPTAKATEHSLLRRATVKLLSFISSPTASSDGAAKADGKDKESPVQDKSEDQSMKTEFKHLDRKYDDEHKLYCVERKKEEIEKGEDKDWWRLYAFCVVRQYDDDGDLNDTYLYVNPQPLRQLLTDVIGHYPADPIDPDDVQITAPYRSLFYYRKELEDVGLRRFEESGDTQSLEQLKLLLGWIKTTFELEIAAYERCLSSDLKAIAYDKLWTIYRPGTIVHAKVHKQDRAFYVLEHWYTDDDDDDIPCFNLKCHFVDYDGDRLGTMRVNLSIPRYGSAREIRLQEVKPLELLEDADEVRERLMARGRRFEQYAVGQHFMQYTGLGLKKDDNSGKYMKFDATGRVMVDVKTFHRLDPNDSISVNGFGKDHEDAKLTDEDRLLANAMVRGYSLNAKKFLELFLDNLSEIEWNSRCFEGLVLDPAIKKTVQALVSTHSQEREPLDDEAFDDIVKGKGRGLVCVLHGPPGVGKTLTAECVAEYVQRPLFMVSSGDLGVTGYQLDRELTEIMDMTSTWRAVLLIDEADVFLEQRALHDLNRNAMVSVFLRVLEYYTGILFLTTNRVTTFDDAFKSRIHIPIRYTDLSVSSRLQIWRSLCKRVPGGVDISDNEYEKLAEIDLNGRQIKNVIKAAESLAAFDKVALDFKQLQQVTKIQATFEKDLETFGDIDYTAPGSAKKHAASGHMYY